MPIVKIQAPSGEAVEIDAPEGATDEQILRFAKSQGFFEQQVSADRDSTQQPQQGQTVFTGDFVPTPEMMNEQGGRYNQAKEQEFTAKEQFIGGLEAAGTLATGATTGALGFALGSLGGAFSELTGILDENQGYKLAEDTAAAFTFTPKTEAGQQLIKEIAEPLSALPPVAMGSTQPMLVTIPTAKTLSASARAAEKGVGTVRRAAQNASSTKKVLADEIAAGNINTGNIAKALDADGTLITNPKTKAAMSLMDNKEAAYSAAINFELMNPATKSQVSKMLDVVNDNYKIGDPVKIMENRPANVIGKSLAKRVNKLNKVKENASDKVGEVVNGDFGKENVSIYKPVYEFIKDLEAEGLPINESKGKLIVDTSNTLLDLPDNKINVILNKPKDLTALEAHKFKKQLNSMVEYDKRAVGTTPPSKEIEDAIKKLAFNIKENLGKQSKAYKDANDRYATVIDTLKKADKMLGNQIMIGDDLAESKLASLSKRIGTNLASKEQVYDLISSLDGTIKKVIPKKYRPKDDIKRQVAFLSDLEKIFNVENAQAPFGLQSRVTQAGIEAATGGATTLTAETGKFVLDRFREMGKKSFAQRMKATRLLLRESTQRAK